MPDTYICAACGELLHVGDVALADAEATANGFDPDECVKVCDGCFGALIDLHNDAAKAPLN